MRTSSTPQGDAVLAVREPAIAEAHSPFFSLTVVLKRRPELEEPLIHELVAGGCFSATLDLTPSVEEFERAFGSTQVAPKLLFIRSVRYAVIRTRDGASVAEVSSASFGGRAALTGSLDAQDTLAFGSALRGEASGLVLEAELTYRDERGSAKLLLRRELQDVLRPLTARFPAEALLTLLCPSPSRGFQELGARLAGNRGPPSPTTLASFGGEAVAMNVALRTGSAPAKAAVLAHSGLLIRPPAPGAWALADSSFVPGPVGVHLPRLDQDDAPLWPDRSDPARFWYAPELALVMPDPQDTPASAPFLFSFRAQGHDSSGQVGLEATIRFRLRPRMKEVTAKAWEAAQKPQLSPVPIGGLSVALEVPFRDPSGRTRMQSIQATSITPKGGDFEATIQLTDQWARLAYGALAFPGFQEFPPRVTAQYVFSAAVKNQLVSGVLGRQLDMPLPPMRGPLLLPPANTVHFPLGSSPTQGRPTILIRPEFVIQTHGSTSSTKAEFPCATFGALYLQRQDGSEKPVGCQNAFALGAAELKLFEPLSLSFGRPAPFTVLRSLQVPGRFLVLPNRYVVARFEPGDDRAYRPALFLFANVDAEDRDRTRCTVLATLEPAVSAYWRAELLAKLRTEVHASAELIWPGDLDTEPAFQWALTQAGPTAVEPSAIRTPEGFLVSLSTGVDGVLLLKSIIEQAGVVGAVAFPLADGTTLRSSLLVDLASVGGPFRAGPVEIQVSGTNAKLINRIEGAVDVSDLSAWVGAKRIQLPVEKRLASGESTTLSLSAGATEPAVDAAPVGGPTSFQEIRTYVEDIYLSVRFLVSGDFGAITSLSVEAAVKGVSGSVPLTLSPAAPQAEITLLLPLTSYVGQPTARYRITKTLRDGPPVAGPWREWRIDTLGNTIELKVSELP
ncbi:MAG: hypothetical protein U1E65_30125 [Myxococcota bacterium]